ncbi:hypothetical protein ACSLMH_10810 [Flavobacterium columnare]|uniref:hypothetical protein n=1 Tax=Flavobacterium columnare TaxID=996 RepID=UPI00403318E1
MNALVFIRCLILLCFFQTSKYEGRYKGSNYLFSLEIDDKQIRIVEGGKVEVHKLFKRKNELFFYDIKEKIQVQITGNRLVLIPSHKLSIQESIRLIYIIDFIKQ